jgi:YD repeat-containing protein
MFLRWRDLSFGVGYGKVPLSGLCSVLLAELEQFAAYPAKLAVGTEWARGPISVVQNLTYAYKSITDGVHSANNQSFGYDVLDRLTSATGAYGTQAFTYDSVGNRLTEVANGTTTSYTSATSRQHSQHASGNGTQRGGTGERWTIDVVICPSAKKRSTTSVSSSVSAACTFISTFSSPVTR